MLQTSVKWSALRLLWPIVKNSSSINSENILLIRYLLVLNPFKQVFPLIGVLFLGHFCQLHVIEPSHQESPNSPSPPNPKLKNFQSYHSISSIINTIHPSTPIIKSRQYILQSFLTVSSQSISSFSFLGLTECGSTMRNLAFRTLFTYNLH